MKTNLAIDSSSHDEYDAFRFPRSGDTLSVDQRLHGLHEPDLVLIPFRSKLEDLFRSNRSVTLKVAGCVFVCLCGVATAVLGWRQKIEWNWLGWGVVVVTVTLLGTLAGFALVLKDVIERRVSDGERVHVLLRAYFTYGPKSVLLWFVTSIVVILLITIITLSL